MVSVCTVPAREGRSCEHFGGYKTINRIPLPLLDSRVLSDEYPYPRVAINCSVFFNDFVLAKLATSS